MNPRFAGPQLTAHATAPQHPGSYARARFFAAVESAANDARPFGQRFAVFLIAVEPGRALAASLTPEERRSLLSRAHLRLAHCVDPVCSIALMRPDTFGLLVPRIQNGLKAREIAARILGTLGRPLRTSVGIAVFPCDGQGAGELLCCAAWALASARRQAQATYRFYLRAFATSAASSSPLL